LSIRCPDALIIALENCSVYVKIKTGIATIIFVAKGFCRGIGGSKSVVDCCSFDPYPQTCVELKSKRQNEKALQKIFFEFNED
jgi:hypothetical protein